MKIKSFYINLYLRFISIIKIIILVKMMKMARPLKPVNDVTLKNWLEASFKSKATRNVYTSALRAFKENLGIKDLGDYVKENPNVEVDLRRFLSSLDGRPAMTISSYTSAVRVFLADHGIEVDGNGWKKLRRRGLMPQRIKASTRDRKPTKKELRRIIDYCSDIKAKALFLFLASSGAKIGETLKLETADFDFEADPPRAFIGAKITKKGVGERTVFMSYEARDALTNWLAVKDSTMRRDGKGTYESPLMFPFSHATALIMWDNATEKAGFNQTDRRTGRKIYHIHSLRKFFLTQIGLDTVVTHALLGHSEYLDDAYVRLNQKEIADAYLDAMPNISIYGLPDMELKMETESLREEVTRLQRKLEIERDASTRTEAIANQIMQTPEFTEMILKYFSEEGFTVRQNIKKGGKIVNVKEFVITPKEKES